MIIWHDVSSFQKKDYMSRICKIAYSGNIAHGNSCSKRRERPLLNKISSMTDNEILEASVKNADERVKNSNAARVLKKIPLLFSAATGIICGALTKGKLSNKALSAAQAFGVGALVYGISKPVEKVSNSIFSKEDEKENSIAKVVFSAAALFGASALALKGIQKGGKVLSKVFAPSADKLKDTLSSHAKIIDSTSLGKLSDKFTKSLSSFAAKRPKTFSALASAALFSPAAAALGAVTIGNNKMKKDRLDITNANINKLILCRELAQASLEK